MRNLKKKQKIILCIIVGIIIVGIYFYIDTKESEFINTNEEILEVDKNDTKIENEKNDEEEKKEQDLIKIHVSGAVNQEGIVELAAESRVADAIEKAGGLKENACMDQINLAYKLEDGMKIYIPTIEEQKKNEENISNTQNDTIVSKSNSEITNNSNLQSSKVNINKATQTELETLPGIGPSTALKIIQYRNENGKFQSIEEIKEVSGIGENKFNQIKSLISV